MIASKIHKSILGFIFGLLTISSVHAQQTVVIERPGLFTDLATAIIGVPAAAVSGIVEGTVESVGSLIHGSTTVVMPPPPVIVPQRQVVVTSPIVTGAPSTTVVTTTPPPVVVPGAVVIQQPTTSIITNYGNGTTVTVTRPASGYELGTNVVHPVAPDHRVGPSPFVNPYVYRYR